ncbi:unnamed protein product, partial [Meganyctiphanes norvegica]
MAVMVYVHGESYSWGAGHIYDGSVLASYTKVIVITLNYRLGPLGFLNLGESGDAVSNQGLMDMLAALSWVYHNIEMFGGNPGRVTLFGHSTGAAIINFLLVSPAAVPGLFHQAILMSGSVHSPWAEVPDALSVTVRLAKHMHCPLPSDLNSRYPETVECLRNVSAQQLVNAGLPEYKFNFMFGPSVDGVVVTKDFKTRQITKLDDGKIPIPVVFGVPEDEGLRHLTRRQLAVGVSIEGRDRIFRTFVRNNYRAHHQEIYLSILKEYSDWANPQSHPIKVRDLVGEALSDGEVVAPLLRLGNSFGKSEQKDAFMYILAHHDRRDHQHMSSTSDIYGGEVPLVFGIPFSQSSGPWPGNFSHQDHLMSEMLMTYWSNFAKTGYPNSPDEVRPRLTHKDRGRQRDAHWEPYDPIYQKYLDIGTRVRKKSYYRSSKVALWNWFIPELDKQVNEQQLQEGQEIQNNWWTADSMDVHHFIGRVRPVVNVRNIVSLAEPSLPTLKILTTKNKYLAPNISASQDNIKHYSLAVDGRSVPLKQGVHRFLDYKSALTIVVFIGLSLLVLNAILIAVLIYHRDRFASSEQTLQYDQPSSLQVCKSAIERTTCGDRKNIHLNERTLTRYNPEIQYTEMKAIPTPPDIISRRMDASFQACNPLESLLSETNSEFNPPAPILKSKVMASASSNLCYDVTVASVDTELCVCNERTKCLLPDNGRCSQGTSEETLCSSAQPSIQYFYEGPTGI